MHSTSHIRTFKEPASSLSVGAAIPVNEDEIEYSFAIEYEGPPVTCNLPRAIPIDVKSIPIASVVSHSQTLGDDKLSLPIVQPLRRKMCEEVVLGSEAVASPTSVIAFGESRKECELSGECSTLESDDNSSLSHEFTSESASQLSCEVQEEDCDNVNTRHARRVTIGGEDSMITESDGSISIVSEYTHKTKEPSVNVHKGSCYRCSKGNRFTEKEVCLVCNAKYCVNCVRRAMGSMPEGRKCVSCIGYAIDESKRMSLGKCSRMLKRLLSEFEIKQIMKVEKSCKVNQLQARLVYVNGKKLSREELILLQNCAHPPKKLQPGHYWYDNVSGLWGKEGQKPCRIISAHLDIGGNMQPNASNGNTDVFINNRVITKVELRLLQWAKVQCAGKPHYWLDESGSYQEEGQNAVLGNLWEKAGTKLLCAALSLPFPSQKIANHPEKEVNSLVSGAFPESTNQGSLQKLLLVGYNGSGTSTIFKQAKILYKAEPFSDHDLLDIKLMIQMNVYSYLGILLVGRERFKDESLAERRKQLLSRPDFLGSVDEGNDTSIYTIGPRLKAFSDWLLKVLESGNLNVILPAAICGYAPLVEELWKDPAIKATFDRRSELEMLPSVASYFLERVVDISRTDYEPSSKDILYAEGITSSNGIACMDFSFPQPVQQGIVDVADQPDLLIRYQLIRVDARGLGEHCKWLEMFEDVRMVMFCVSLSDYDQLCDDRSGVPTNKILASKKLFEEIISHPNFEKMDFLLILSKYDLLEEKIERVPLSECNWFDDFSLVRSNHPSNNSNNFNYIASPAEQAFHYIAAKFKKLFNSLTGRKLYVSLVNGLEPGTVNQAFTYTREILKWDEERNNVDVYDSHSNIVTAGFSR